MSAGSRAPLVLGALLGTLLAAPVPAQAPFEGTVTMRVGARSPQGATMAQEMEYLISGTRMRVNLGGPAGGMSMLLMPTDKKMVMLMAEQRSYVEMPMPEAIAATERANANAPRDVKVTRTGKSETIAGHSCEHLQIASPDPAGAMRTIDACLAKSLGRLVNPMGVLSGAQQQPWQKALAGEGFPLRITGPDGDVLLEVTHIEKKRLANTLFAIPDNYARMAMPPRR